MTALMDELLEFARPAPPERLPTDMTHLLADAVEIYRAEHDPAKLEVVLDVAPGLYIFHVDSGELAYTGKFAIIK